MKVKRSGFILPILFHPGNPPTEALAKVGPDSDTLILPIRLILRIVFRPSYPVYPLNPGNLPTGALAKVGPDSDPLILPILCIQDILIQTFLSCSGVVILRILIV